MEDFIHEQRKVNDNVETKIDTRMNELKTSCITHLTMLFENWGNDADKKIQTHCESTAANHFEHIESRPRKVPNNNINPHISASPSGSTNSAVDSPMEEVLT